MGSKLNSYNVEDISLEMGDAPFGSNLKNQDYTDTGALVIQGRNIQGRKTDWTEKRHISLSKYESLHRSHCSIGDLIFPKVGTIGKVGILTPCPGYQRYVLSTNTMRLRVDPAKADPLYVYYYFTWGRTANLIHAQNSKSVQPVFNFTSLKKFKLELPSLDQQKQISSILGSLDDKITLNSQINTTLESMAQALFKSWFVDFDPVIDNALAAGNPIPEPLQARADARAALGDQRKPLPNHIRQQFPDWFVLTEEMGWVPDGWEVTPLSEAIEINPKVTIKKGQKAKHVDMKALPTSGYCVGEVSEKEYAGGAKFERGDVLLARITPCLENGKTGVVDFLADGEPGFGSTEFIVMRPKNAIGTSFVAALARQEAFRQHCISNMVGSSGRQRVQNSCFDTYFICTPKVPDILDLYRENCEAWFEKMTTLANESRSLEMLRDTLLPKLLSGELRIPEAKAEVSEAL